MPELLESYSVVMIEDCKSFRIDFVCHILREDGCIVKSIQLRFDVCGLIIGNFFNSTQKFGHISGYKSRS